MSQENVEIVRQALEAVVACDQRRAEELFAPHAEWRNTSVFPGQRTWRGPEAIVAFWRTLSEDFEKGGMEIEDSREGEAHVVVGFHSWGRGKRSGVPIDVRWAATFSLRDQRIVLIEVYGSYVKALEAVGLSE